MNRLRALVGRDRIVAAVALALVLLPFVVALVRAFRDGWVPSGDEANIATRALDVFSRHPPLTGLPSTSGFYGDKIQTNHPGPIEFYLLAVPIRVLGLTVGTLLTAVAINASFVLIALWVFFRRLGLTAMVWAAVLLLAVMGSGGTAVLTDTVSSNMTMYSLLAMTVLAWALIDGDLALLPLATLVASYAAQQHLAAGLVALPVVLVAVFVLAARTVIQARRGDAIVATTARRWSLVAVAIAAMCWAPVAFDEVGGHPGNLTQIVRFARDKTRPTLGFESGIYQAVHAVAPPSVLARTDTNGLFFVTAPGPFRWILAAVIVVALVVIAWSARKRSPARSRLAFVALVVLAAGILNGSNVPQSFEAGRINLYRWTWAAAFVTWAALGIGAVMLVGRIANGSELWRRASVLVPTALLVVAALVASSIVFVTGSDDHNALSATFRAERRIAQAALAHVDRHHPVLVVEEGNAANLAIGPYVIARLVEAGLTVEVPRFVAATYGTHRAYRPGPNVSAIVVLSGVATLPSAPGALLATEPFDRERTMLLDTLAATARGVPVVLAAGAEPLIRRLYPGVQRISFARLLARLRFNSRAALEQTRFLQLVLEGALRSPRFDDSQVRRLLAMRPERTTFAADEEVSVRLVDAGQLQTPDFEALIARAFVLG